MLKSATSVHFSKKLLLRTHIVGRIVGIFLIICAALLLSRVFFGNKLALVAWKRYRSPEIALALNQSNAAFSMAIGNYYFNGGAYDLARAKRAYEQAVRIDPQIPLGHYQRARIYFVEGQFHEAREEINKELAMHPENLRSLYIRGLIDGYGGSPDLAAEDFRKFIEWSPGEWAGYNDLAWALARLKKYSDMEVVAEKGIKNAIEGALNPWLWNMRGVAQLNLKKYGAAHEAFVHAKKFSETLTDEEWRRAYPGNDPGESEGGRGAFLQAIEENLAKAKQGVDKTF